MLKQLGCNLSLEVCRKKSKLFSIFWFKVEEEVHLLCKFVEAEVGQMVDVIGKYIS